MKTIQRTSLLMLVAALALTFHSCTKDKCTVRQTTTKFDPIYMPYDEFRSSVASEGPRAMKNPGKIYFQGNYIFINERNEGIHIIDNSDTYNPQKIAFLKIPGNVDLAVKNNTLYTDSYIDLVVFDISDPANPSEVNRVEKALPQRTQPRAEWVDDNLGVVTGFEANDVTETLEQDCNDNGGGFRGDDIFIDEVFTFDAGTQVTGAPMANAEVKAGGAGDALSGGGSMARFALAGDYLYIVDNANLHAYNISSETNPVKSSENTIGWDIETIFPYGNHLFIGSMSGMHIYNIDDPTTPTYVSSYQHFTACDPVVVEGDYAYVTLRSGTPCATFNNQLDVVDISDLTSPFQTATYPMHNPHGLGIQNSTLFLCDGDAGLKIFDAGDVQTIDDNQLFHHEDINAFDVIPTNRTLFMIGADGFLQYDFRDLSDIKIMSTIPVE